MTFTTFDQLFVQATGIDSGPFPFQRRFATGAALPNLVRAPTGLGKTAMAVLGWLWRRQFAEDAVQRATPRRLVYCLPMRVLVEQTRDSMRSWLENLGLAEQVQVYVLMGGEGSEDWDLHPEKPAILIGTQDMLLSRALNRGYGMSRYRWPMHFSLLNNDSLWIFDEVQLMDVGVATSAQLEGFRASMKVFGPTRSIWMSATLDESWLETVDSPKEQLGRRLELDEQDLQNKHVKKLWTAPKPLYKSNALMGNAPECADAIAEAHRPGTKTLAVFNTVKRAVDVFKRLQRLAEHNDIPRPVLIHSRFRSDDRERHLRTFLEGGDIIAVTTQVVEAGVDVSATTLLTELAPWASLVQRFGRCNRRGGDQEAKVIWFDPGEMGKKSKDIAPYKPYKAEDLREARRVLLPCGNVSLQALDGVDAEMPLEAAHVIRRRDLVDLFDTTPDLAGNDIDVSRFIRSGDEHDVKVFWRDFVQHPDEAAPRREELCSVPVREFRDFYHKRRAEIWRWDGLEEDWSKVEKRHIYPGQTFLVRSESGGYDPEVGWEPKSGAVKSLLASEEALEGYSRDYEDGRWMSIAGHTNDVVGELNEILADLPITKEARKTLGEAARRHDWGKAHEVFQNAVEAEGRRPEWQGRRDVGKAPNDAWKKGYDRRGFRHELASALAMLQMGMSDLSAYLAAAHHGKVRLSIRSLSNEKRPDEPGRLHARGVWDGDELPSVALGGGAIAPSSTLSLECMQIGRSADGSLSWAERMLRLRDEWGSFRLAYLETLLRAADMRASQLETMKSPEAQYE